MNIKIIKLGMEIHSVLCILSTAVDDDEDDYCYIVPLCFLIKKAYTNISRKLSGRLSVTKTN